MTKSSLATFACKCKAPKKHRLKLDSGPSGEYALELCESCYQKDDKRFVIEEEIIS